MSDVGTHLYCKCPSLIYSSVLNNTFPYRDVSLCQESTLQQHCMAGRALCQ